MIKTFNHKMSFIDRHSIMCEISFSINVEYEFMSLSH